MGNATRKQVATFIDTHPLAVVSINRKHRAPHAAAVFVTYDENFNFFFVTKSDTEKFKAVKKEARAAITITDLPTQTTIQAEGKAHEITPEGHRTESIFKKLAQIKPKGEMDWLPPIFKLKAGHYVIIEVETDWLRYGNFKDMLNSDKTEVFTQVIGDDV